MPRAMRCCLSSDSMHLLQVPGSTGSAAYAGVQARRALPSEMVEEEPVYVNARQYHCILRRRAQRAKAEAENKLIKTRRVRLLPIWLVPHRLITPAACTRNQGDFAYRGEN